jgi:hypothetical protein
MERRRQRLCRFCNKPIPATEPPQSRYCRRSHRQRAYEARQVDQAPVLRRRLRALRRQVAAFEECIDQLSQHPVYGSDVAAAFVGAYVPLVDEPGGERRLHRFTTWAELADRR